MKKIVIIALALSLMMLIISGCQEKPADTYMREGEKFLKEGEFDKAISEFKSVLKLEPDNVDALMNLMLAYESNGDEANAQQIKGQLRTYFKDEVKYLTSLGTFYIQNAKIDEAQEVIEEAMKLAPQSPQVRFLRGSIYEFKGEFEKALDEYNVVLTLNPPDELVVMTKMKMGMIMQYQMPRKVKPPWAQGEDEESEETDKGDDF